MGVLAGGVEGVAVAAAIVLADRGAGLDGVGDLAVVDEVEAGDVVGAGEGLVGRVLVAQRPIHAGVVGSLIVQLWRSVFGRLGRIDGGREHPVIDPDRLHPVSGLSEAIGDHHGHQVADEAYLAQRQGRARRRVLRPAVGGEAARHAAQSVGGDVVAGEDLEHPGQGRRPAGVDAV